MHCKGRAAACCCAPYRRVWVPTLCVTPELPSPAPAPAPPAAGALPSLPPPPCSVIAAVRELIRRTDPPRAHSSHAAPGGKLGPVSQERWMHKCIQRWAGGRVAGLRHTDRKPAFIAGARECPPPASREPYGDETARLRKKITGPPQERGPGQTSGQARRLGTRLRCASTALNVGAGSSQTPESTSAVNCTRGRLHASAYRTCRRTCFIMRSLRSLPAVRSGRVRTARGSQVWCVHQRTRKFILYYKLDCGP